MNLFVALGLLAFALSFCNLSQRLAQFKSGDSGNRNSSVASPADRLKSPAENETAEKPRLSAEQQAIFDRGESVEWKEQGMFWTLPAKWSKMSVGKTTFNYNSPDQAFLLVNISVMADDFPSDVSLRATYESALQQLKNGTYANVRYLEIDGVKGVEFIEAMPEDKGDARRLQWLAYRNYLGQNQMLNVMLSTRGDNFERQSDVFPAILYSMKIAK